MGLGSLAAISGVINGGFATAEIAKSDGSFKEVATSVVAGAGQVGIDVATEVGSKALAKSIASAAAQGSWLAATGPIGWAIEAVLFIIQITGILIDAFFNPFKTYYNKDLTELKEKIDATLRKKYLKEGYDYPLIIKPDIFPTNDEEKKVFKGYIREYLDNNGLITDEDVITEEDLVSTLQQLKRHQDLVANPLYNDVNLYSATNQNIALLIAAAVAKKKGYGNLDKAVDMDFQNYKISKYTKYKNWTKVNWQILLILITVLSMMSVFAGILIL
jgi:hypothetical protein